MTETPFAADLLTAPVLRATSDGGATRYQFPRPPAFGKGRILAWGGGLTAAGVAMVWCGVAGGPELLPVAGLGAMAVLCGLAAVGVGIVRVRCDLTIAADTATVVWSLGSYRPAQTVPFPAGARIVPVGSSLGVADGSTTTRLRLYGYPNEWLAAVAADFAARRGVIDPPRPAGAARPVPPPPPRSRAVVEHPPGGGLVIDFPPPGLWRGVPWYVWALTATWWVIAGVVTVRVWLTATGNLPAGPDDRRADFSDPGEWFGAAVLVGGLWVGALVWLLPAAVAGRAGHRIEAVGGRLRVVATGSGRGAVREWAAGELAAVRATEKDPDDELPDRMRLVIEPRVGRPLAMFGGNDPGEVVWLAGAIRAALDLPD